jgi:hypothetical protein
MNSSWTGRAPRMLRDCHFSDGADPIERSRRTGYSAAWWISIGLVALLSVMAIWNLAAR